MKKIVFGLIGLAVLASCEKEVNQSGEDNLTRKSTNADYWKQNVGFLTPQVVYLNSSTFFKTIEVFDFEGSENIHDVLKIEGNEYADNGQYNGVEAGDGIYSSVVVYNVDNDDPSQYSNLYFNVCSEFTHDIEESITSIESGGAKSSGKKAVSKVSGKITFGCDVDFGVPCPGTSWYNESWFGSSCIEFTSCSFEIELGW